MESTTAKTLMESDGPGFMDQNCSIEHDGRTFEAGGGFILFNPKANRYEGIVYGDWGAPTRLRGEFRTEMLSEMNYNATVTNWHGDIKIKAVYGRVYRSNMGDLRRLVWFDYAGRHFSGVWYSIDNNQSIRVKEVKSR
jgi:hypothetical protein